MMSPARSGRNASAAKPTSVARRTARLFLEMVDLHDRKRIALFALTGQRIRELPIGKVQRHG